MGYYTSYNISWQPQKNHSIEPECSHKNTAKAKFCEECGESLLKGGKHSIKALDQIVGDYIENSDFCGAVDRNGKCNDACKWYEVDVDMRKMSEDIPNVLFHVTGEGEEAGDIWDAWALNGKWQRQAAKIVRGKPKPGDWS